MRVPSLAFFGFLLSVCATGAAPLGQPPIAPERPVTDTYFGTQVVDPYRWMENRTSPAFVRYMLAQGAYARRVLDAIPARANLQARVTRLSGGGAVLRLVQSAGDRTFFLKREPSENAF